MKFRVSYNPGSGRLPAQPPGDVYARTVVYDAPDERWGWLIGCRMIEAAESDGGLIERQLEDSSWVTATPYWYPPDV